MTELDYDIPLAHVLELPSITKTAIKNEYTTNDERKRAAIHYFFHNHPYSSWRLLILNFDQTYGPEVADTIRHLAEKLTGIINHVYLLRSLLLVGI